MLGITTCVNYSRWLRRTLPVWAASLSKIVVVTSPADCETGLLGSFFENVEVFVTDRFYDAGPETFNKGGALQDAWMFHWPQEGWVCHFDADTLPPADWRERLPALDTCAIYGARRVDESSRAIRDPDPAGYFLLFNIDCPRVEPQPLFTSWRHAGGYDTDLVRRWPAHDRRWLDFNVTHMGETGVNWWGIHGDAGRRKMSEMRHERRQRGGYEHERLEAGAPQPAGHGA